MADTTSPRRALLAGGSGLIGRELLTLLLASPRYVAVHALVRRSMPWPADPKLHLLQTDFDALATMPPVDDVFIALGTTIKVAGSEAAFRRVDFDAVVDTARAARAAGASRLAVVSALGADAASRIFYNRVKGEMQAAIARLGYDTVVIAQPSFLWGDRTALGQPVRRGEEWARRLTAPLGRLVPRGVRPIAARSVANALFANLAQERPGVHMLSSGQMQDFAP
jgi:uncharacterized protein YbjT (DUF2867 family)